MKNKIDTSRRCTPWDKNSDISPTQKFIMETYKENYVKKHPKLSDTNEADIFNSIIIKKCRHCNFENIIKYGKTSNEIQVYLCKRCNKKFTIMTGTIFENHKISITEWVEFLLDIFNYGSTSLTSKVNKNSINTSIYWLQKVFILLKEIQKDVILEGKVYIDEMFYKVIKSDIQKNNGKELRGLSQNQHCIGIGYDGNNIIAVNDGLGKTSKTKTSQAFSQHIKPNSTLIHDEEKSHLILINKLKLKNISYNSNDLKKLEDKDNPLRKINHQCDLIRQFLNTHSGFDRENLQDYLNLYCFMNSGHKNKLKKVDELLVLALTTKVTLKYRDLFKIKDNK